MLFAVDYEIKKLLRERLNTIEEIIGSDVLVYSAPIDDFLLPHINELLNKIEDNSRKEKLTVILTTGGGSATATERLVNIFRHFYRIVDFLVPDYAYSAGTILCLSGDNILMNYNSVLGPIDPQVRNKEGHWVAALGYLDKIDELVIKAQKGQLTDAEFMILKDFDLAELRSYEQAKDLTIDLLKKWLVQYKFKNWNQTKDRRIQVTDKMREDRAKEIAQKLNDNKRWKSHGRPINIETLVNELNLIIEDYGDNGELYGVVDLYSSLLRDYLERQNKNICIHFKENIII